MSPAASKRSRWPRVLSGVVLFVAGVFVTIWLAVLPAETANAPLVGTLLVVLAGLLQGISAFLLSGSGRADPSLARSAVSRLILLAQQAQRARKRAEQAFETETGAALKSDVGILSAELSFLEEGIGSAAQDWAVFHPEAIRRLDEENQ